MGMGAHLKAKMSLDSSGVKAGVGGADKAVGGFSNQLAKIGPQLAAAFSVGAIVGFTKKVIEYGSQISDLAYQTGLSTDELQAFQVAVTNAGGSVEQASKGLLGLRDAQLAALNGEAMYVKAFERLGIKVEDLAGKSMPELLQAVSENYAELQDFGALVDLFGKRNAGKMEEALISLADNGFGALIEKTKEAGLLLSDEKLFQLDAMADRWERGLIRMKVGFADLVFDLEKIWRPVARMFDAAKEGLFAGFEAARTDLKNLFTGKWGEKVESANLIGVMGDASSRSWSADKKTEAEIDARRNADREERANAQAEREAKQAAARAQALEEKKAAAELAEKEKKVAFEVAEKKRVEALRRKIWEEEGNDEALRAADAKTLAAKRSAEMAAATSAVERDLIQKAHDLEDKKLATAKQVSDIANKPPPGDGKKTKDLGQFYSGGNAKSIEAAKGFLHVGTDDLGDQLDFWKNKLAGSGKKSGGNFDSLGWNSAFHSARGAERDQFNQAAMKDVIGRIEMLISKQGEPQPQLSSLEKETIEQTRILRELRNAQQFANL